MRSTRRRRARAASPGFSAVAEIAGPVDLAVIASPRPNGAGRAGGLRAGRHPGRRRDLLGLLGGGQQGGRGRDQAHRPPASACASSGRIAPASSTRTTSCSRSIETRPPKGAGGVHLTERRAGRGGALVGRRAGAGFQQVPQLRQPGRPGRDRPAALPGRRPETRVGALYIESVADGRRFLDAVREFTRRKPLVVIKSGRSQSGQRATLSHTGSMAGADAVYDAALRSCGAIRVGTRRRDVRPVQGVRGLPPIKGRRVAIVTNSGGPGVLAADRAEDVGLEVAEPSPGLRERLGQFLPASLLRSRTRLT